MPRKNVGLIGAGRMGRAHALALGQLGLPLSAICDLREDALNALGTEFAVPENRRFSDPSAMFAALEPLDLLIIATTADTHCALTCTAAEAGVRAILCEKPMATSVAQCDAMLAACAKSGARLAINHQMRFMPQYRIVRGLLDQGKLGRLASMNVVAGCFGLAMNGSHYIEAFNFLTGCWPVEVWGWFTGEPVPNPRGPRFFDQAGDFRFIAKNGQRLTMSIGHDQGHGMTVTYAGAYGHIFVDELEGECIASYRLPEHRTMAPTRYGMPWERSRERFAPADNVEPTRQVIAALMDGTNYPDGNAGRQIVAAIAACYTSAENGGQLIRLERESASAKVFDWA